MSDDQHSTAAGSPEPTARELRAARRRAHEEEKKRQGASGGGKGKMGKGGKGGDQQPPAGDRSRH